ncbi:MAG TPA: chemotaxis protein CheB [Acidimicrobiales bacterium]
MSALALAVIGASWGGMAAVGALLEPLGETISIPLAVALHRSPTTRDDALVRSLARRCKLPVVEADDKTALEPGHVYVAPADYHLLVDDGHLSLSVEPPVRFSRPSIDVLFESAAEVYGEGVVAVVLTGANDDGARGVVKVKEHGGTVFVQDPATAERREMPDAAIATNAVDRVLPVPAIAAALNVLGGAA